MNESAPGVVGRFDMNDLYLAVSKPGKENRFIEPDRRCLEQWCRRPSDIDVRFPQQRDPDQTLANDNAPVARWRLDKAQIHKRLDQPVTGRLGQAACLLDFGRRNGSSGHGDDFHDCDQAIQMHIDQAVPY